MTLHRHALTSSTAIIRIKKITKINNKQLQIVVHTVSMFARVGKCSKTNNVKLLVYNFVNMLSFIRLS